MEKFQPFKKLANADKVVISIRISEEKLAHIDKLAYKVDISRNELILQCIDYALKNMEIKKEKDK